MSPDFSEFGISEMERIFARVANLPRGDRGVILDTACEGFPELRARVEGLLRAHDEAGFMDEATVIMKLKIDAAAALARAGEDAFPPPAISRQTNRVKPQNEGDPIGNYKLREQIGEGGFGEVWVAEQQRPVRRQVALKIIKLGMDTREVVSRFEQERQALAMMDHPNIAKVFDAGATDSGRPYFVMELVRGIPITVYCDQANLPAEERLLLFITVCHAVQHAHQKGIIHRDIKPSNILVTLHDGVPVPKVIDFGIAKATQARLSENTIYTRFEQMIGTPLYMSPEQAELSGLDIDTRSDIYSLGVLLYELLVGRTPFEPAVLMNAGMDEMRRMIREQVPPKPSTALMTMAADTRSKVALHRQSDATKIASRQRGDLDWIVMKALEKDRSRRYETANGMAQDIRRHLDNEPVLAGPPSATYRFGKFARRNKAFLTGLAIIAGILVAATGISIWQASLARHATVEANEARRQASANARAETAAREESEATVSFLTDVFQSPDPNRDGRSITVAEVLDKAAKNLGPALNDQPALQASLKATLGKTYRSLGLVRDAIPLLEQARDYWVANRGPEDPGTLSVINTLALFYFEAGRRDEARPLQESVLKLRRKILGPEHADTIATMSDVAQTYYTMGSLIKARGVQEQVMELSRKVNGPRHPATLRAMSLLARYFIETGSVKDALSLREEVVKLEAEVSGSESDQSLWAKGELANSWDDAGLEQQSLKLREEIYKSRLRLSGPEHPDTLWVMNNLASNYHHVGRDNDAYPLWDKTLALRRKVSGENHPDTLSLMKAIAGAYLESGRKDEAIRLQQEVLKRYKESRGAEDSQTLGQMREMSVSLSWAGRKQEALAMAEQGLAISQRIYGSDHLTTCTAESLYASNLLAMGRKEEALAVLAKIPLSKGSDAMLMQRTTAILLWFGRDDEHEAVCRKMLEQVADTKDPGVADRVAKACNLRASPPLDMVDAALELARKSTELGKGQNLNPFFKLCLGLAQYRKGDYKAAETSLDEVRASGDRSWNILHLNRFLTAMNTYKLGREEEARTLLAKAETEFGTFPVDELKPFSQPRGVEPIIVWVIHREAKALIFPGGR